MQLNYNVENDVLTIGLEGHIDSLNASDVEASIRANRKDR